MFRFAYAAAFGLALAAPALAQTAWVEIDDATVVPGLNMSADAIEDMDVTGPGGTKIGEVEEVVGASASAPTALVVDFDDDANYGDRDRVIPVGDFMSHDNMLMLSTEPEDVVKLEAYED